MLERYFCVISLLTFMQYKNLGNTLSFAKVDLLPSLCFELSESNVLDCMKLLNVLSRYGEELLFANYSLCKTVNDEKFKMHYAGVHGKW